MGSCHRRGAPPLGKLPGRDFDRRSLELEDKIAPTWTASKVLLGASCCELNWSSSGPHGDFDIMEVQDDSHGYESHRAAEARGRNPPERDRPPEGASVSEAGVRPVSYTRDPRQPAVAVVRDALPRPRGIGLNPGAEVVGLVSRGLRLPHLEVPRRQLARRTM